MIVKGTNKKNKRIIGGSLIAIAAITMFYQWKFSQVTYNSKIYVAVASTDIYEGELLTNDNIELVLRDKEELITGYITDLESLKDGVAKELIRKNEEISVDSYESKEEYAKKDQVLVSIKGFDGNKDLFDSYEVKPFDKVDLYFYDQQGVYQGKPYLQNLIVNDIKSAEGISYKDRMDGFIPTYANFWVEGKVAEDINSKQEMGGYFKMVIHRDRSNYDTNN